MLQELVDVEKVSQSDLIIGFDAKRIFHNATGLGNYARTILHNLSDAYPSFFNLFLFTPHFTPNSIGRELLYLKNTQIIYPKFFNSFLWRMFFILKDLNKQNIQIYHGLSNELPFEWSKTNKIKWVVSIHDIAFQTFKEDYSFFDRLIHHYKIKYSCHKADLIIAISEFTKMDICKTFSVSPEKVHVLYQTVQLGFKIKYNENDIQNVLSKNQIPKQFYLFVGSITFRKNLLAALKAWQLLPEEYQLPFVIVGKSNRKYFKQIRNFLNSLQKEKSDKIIFRNVTNEHLPYIYQSASVFIYPSHFEGFGIPVLEALYSGIPVITSNKSALPEVAGEGAYLVNPSDVMEIRAGIIHFMSDKDQRQNAINKGFEHTKNFDAQLLTKQLVHLYQRLI